MKLLLLPFKLLAIPVALICWAIKWIGTFITAMSGWIFYGFASLLCTLSLIFILFGEATFREMVPAFICSFCVFIVPFIGAWITGMFAAASSNLREFIFS